MSNYSFSVTKNNQIIYGLGAIKGVGNAIIEIIIEERDSNGIFTSLDDVLRDVVRIKLIKE